MPLALVLRAPSETRVVERAAERDHLHGADRRVPPLVAGLGPGPLDRLLDRVGREHAEDDGHRARLRGRPEAAGRLAGNIVEGRGRAAGDGAERDGRRELPGPGEPAGNERKLPRARHADDRHVLGQGAVADERVDGPLDQAVDDEVVEAAGDDAEPCSLGYDQASFDHARRHRCPCSAPWPIEWSGTRSTTSRPKPWMPASLRGLLVKRRISCRPRSTSPCAPRPNSRSGASFEGDGMAASLSMRQASSSPRTSPRGAMYTRAPRPASSIWAIASRR